MAVVTLNPGGNTIKRVLRVTLPNGTVRVVRLVAAAPSTGTYSATYDGTY